MEFNVSHKKLSEMVFPALIDEKYLLSTNHFVVTDKTTHQEVVSTFWQPRSTQNPKQLSKKTTNICTTYSWYRGHLCHWAREWIRCRVQLTGPTQGKKYTI